MIRDFFSLHNFRNQLTNYEALPQLVLLGLVCGILTGLLIAAFRLAIDIPLSFLLIDDVENFEDLSIQARFLLPSLGGITLALLIAYLPLMRSKVGLVYLLERLAYHQGQIPGKSLFAQFLLAVIALVSGQSVGREGPAIYMGAGVASLLGNYLKVPFNVNRLLLACGGAAAISAAFNTPLAGVIFAMEVILLDYTIAGFTPIIVAAVTSSLITRLIFSAEPIFQIPAFDLLDHYEILWIIFLGVFIGTLATIFIKLMNLTKVKINLSLSYKLAIAGIVTGCVAIFYPQVMGTGYDTIIDSMWGRIDIQLLLYILVAKLLLTAIILGLGMPAGMIGPTLFIGAVGGAFLGICGSYFADSSVSHVGLYTMLGMGAMMAATLNAPLAALIALLELTYNPHIIFPAMIAIVVANLTTQYLFRTPSAFLASLQAQGFDYRIKPLAQALNRVSVGKVMDRSICLHDNNNLLNKTFISDASVKWLVIKEQQKYVQIYLLADIVNYSSPQDSKSLAIDENEDIALTSLQHLAIDVIKVNVRDTLSTALIFMNQHQTDTLCVFSHNEQAIGIITRSQVEYYYNNVQ